MTTFEANVNYSTIRSRKDKMNDNDISLKKIHRLRMRFLFVILRPSLGTSSPLARQNRSLKSLRDYSSTHKLLIYLSNSSLNLRHTLRMCLQGSPIIG